MKESISIKVPGKLMVAGEYAVLEPNQHLVVTAVDRFIYVTIKSSEVNLLTLNNFNLLNMHWHYEKGQARLSVEDNRTSFVRAAMGVTIRYLKEQGHTLHPVALSITSELDDQSGIKYGLGSSAAVVTGVVTALLTKFLPTEPTKNLIFKLAAIAHVKTQGSGSGADIAASTYGGVLEYSSFQANWLLEQIKRKASITALIHKQWKFLYIKQLHFPKHWQMIVGWTGTPASTAKLVPKVLAYKQLNPDKFNNFVAKSAQSVIDILSGIETENIARFFKGIQSNHRALADIGKLANVPIETELLYELHTIADKHDSAGKISGAGGGDCGIAFTASSKKAEAIRADWEKAGINFLHMTTYSFGAKKQRTSI